MSFFTYHVRYSSHGDLIAKRDIVLKPTDVDTSTTLELPGQGKTNYGEFYNKNILQMMEHFAKSTPPNTPTTGQIWYQPVESAGTAYNIAMISDDTVNPASRDVITISGNHAADFPAGKKVSIANLTIGASNGAYVVASAAYDGINTNIKLTTNIRSATVSYSKLLPTTGTAQITPINTAQRLRYYTGEGTRYEDPTYPGWTNIQVKIITQPSDPQGGDSYYNNVDGTTMVWNGKDGVWDVFATQRWTNSNYVRLDGANTPMTGALRLISSSGIEASPHGDTAVSKDWAVRHAGDTNLGLMSYKSNLVISAPDANNFHDLVYAGWALYKGGDTMSGILNMGQNRITELHDPIQDYDAVNKRYVDGELVTVNETIDRIKRIDWEEYYSTRSVPYDNAVDNHPGTDKTGHKYWDTLFRRNGILEVNNIYWRNISDEIKDKLQCAMGGMMDFTLGTPPPNSTLRFKSWVDDRDKMVALYYGIQPVTKTLTVDLITTMNYSSAIGPGGMLGVSQKINLNNYLMLEMRKEMGDPTFTIHENEYGYKYTIEDTTLGQVTTDTKNRASIPRIPLITGYSLPMSTPSTTFPGTNLLMNYFDMYWWIKNFGSSYTGPTGFTGANDTRFYVSNFETTRDDDTQEFTFWITVVDKTTNPSGDTYEIAYRRPYSITDGDIDALVNSEEMPISKNGSAFVGDISSIPPHVRIMARFKANWQYNDYDIRNIIDLAGNASPNSWGNYPDSYPGVPASNYATATVLTATMGLLWLTTERAGNPGFTNYLQNVGYTQGLAFSVSTTNFDRVTGNLDFSVNLTSGSVGYSYFPANLLVNKATVPVTFKLRPILGTNPNNPVFPHLENILDISTFTAQCDW